MNFIEELYYGNIRLSTQEHISTETYKQATAIILRITAQLREALSEPELTLLERLIEANNEVIGETGAAEFQIGFALGVRMITDCFSVDIEKIATANN